jgi:hypothetical protein
MMMLAQAAMSPDKATQQFFQLNEFFISIVVPSIIELF